MALAAAVVLLAGTAAGCALRSTAATTTSREFGVALDPWRIEEWANAVGATPTMVMEFESWNRARTLDAHFAQAHAAGLQSFMVTWEPWSPVDTSATGAAQAAVQPAYSNDAIAAGRQDSYIHAFARSVAAAPLTVHIRFGHEMNGTWYPWTHDPARYIAAWRHIVDIFRQDGAQNARFVFSLNPQMYQTDGVFTAAARSYWPGAGYVDDLGSSMINFGGSMQHSVASFADRIRLMHATFGKPLLLTEVNTAAENRVAWLTDLRSWLSSDAGWLKGVVLSQGQSRGKVSLGDEVGTVDWDVTTDARARPVVRAIIADIRRS